MAPKPQLFISHSSGDTAAAKAVHDGLTGDFEVFLDAYDLRAGNDWQKGIEAAIVSCDCALVMLSPSVKARPEWVAVEAYSFGLRQRVLDPSFLVIPIMLPGFTAADLALGPLAPAKLNAIQGLSMDPNALDLQPLKTRLDPVLQTYGARLPFFGVTVQLASVIDGLGPNARDIIALALGVDKAQLNNATNPARWLAAALLASDRTKLEQVYLDLKPTQASAASQIFRTAAPYTWVDKDAAACITKTGLSGKPRAPVTVAASRVETPKFCVLRGSLKANGWPSFDGEAVFSDPEQEQNPEPPDVATLLVANIRKSLKNIAGFRDDQSPTDAEIEAALDDSPMKDEPIFVFLEPWFADMDAALMGTLRAHFPRLVFMVRTESPQAGLDKKFQGIVVLPSLAADIEGSVYRMYNRCLPGVRLP
jgi:hypothetical protein